MDLNFRELSLYLLLFIYVFHFVLNLLSALMAGSTMLACSMGVFGRSRTESRVVWDVGAVRSYP